MKKGSDSEPLYSENYLKTKEKSYYSKTNTYLNTNKHLSVEILWKRIRWANLIIKS